MKQEDIILRRAALQDLPSIVAILADDPLGAKREAPSLPLGNEYLEAFQAIVDDPNQFLAVAEDGDIIAGTFQLTFLPGLSHKGSWRCQIEAVRVAKSHRNAGLGETMLKWTIDMAKSRGCKLVQLTTDKTRLEAHRFYDRLGFQASHEGYKLVL